MKFTNPEKIGWELCDFALLVIFGEFLFVVVEAGGKTALGEFVHLFGANLKLNNLFVFGDYSGMDGLVSVLLWGGNIIFDTAVHGGKKGMDESECEVAGGDVIKNEAEGDKVVNAINVLVVFVEFFVKGINGFYATVG